MRSFDRRISQDSFSAFDDISRHPFSTTYVSQIFQYLSAKATTMVGTTHQFDDQDWTHHLVPGIHYLRMMSLLIVSRCLSTMASFLTVCVGPCISRFWGHFLTRSCEICQVQGISACIHICRRSFRIPSSLHLGIHDSNSRVY